MKYVISFLLLLHTLLTADELPAIDMADETSYDVDPEIIESCTLEGQSHSYQGDKLKAWIEECIEDFADTEPVITP